MTTPSLSYSSGSISERGRLTYSITTLWLLVGFLVGITCSLVTPPARRPQLRFVRQQTSGALTYPIIMMCVGTAIMTFLLMYVVPEVATIFEQQHAALPLATRLLIAVSARATAHWLGLVLLLFVLVAGIAGSLATPTGNRLYHHCIDTAVLPFIRENTDVIEPVMTLAMAAVIVFMMLAVLMPIFQLNQLMQ